jgi:hypothetical protein
MEGFLQSLKIEDMREQERVCCLAGPIAQNMGRKHDWRVTGTLWWRGKPYDRLSDEYQDLLDRAYQALFDQSEQFRTALCGHGRRTSDAHNRQVGSVRDDPDRRGALHAARTSPRRRIGVIGDGLVRRRRLRHRSNSVRFRRYLPPGRWLGLMPACDPLQASGSFPKML